MGRFCGSPPPPPPGRGKDSHSASVCPAGCWSELPTDSDAAAVVCAAPVDEVMDGALDVVGLSVEQSCLRMDTEDTLPVLQDERSVMSFLVRPVAVLISQFFLLYDDCGDDRFSPGVSDRGSLDCHVDLDSLWMIYWEDRRNVETGSRTGLSDWRCVLCCVALLSRLPEFPDTDCLNCFSDVGKNCVLDLNARGTYIRVRPPECGLETVAPMLPIQHCRVAEVRGLIRGGARLCAVVRGCMVAREMDIPRAKHRMRGSGCFSGRDGVRGRLGLYKDWVTFLWISPQTCTGLTAAALAFSGPDVDCAGGFLALLSFSVVEYNVIRNRFACCGPGGCRHFCFDPAAGYVFGTCIGLEVC